MLNPRPEIRQGVRQDGLSSACLAILEHMPVAVVVAAAPSGRVLWSNKRSERITGRVSTPVPGISDYLHYEGAYELREYPHARVVLNGETIERQRFDYRRHDGRILRLEVSGSRVRTRHGRDLAVFAFQDVTAEHELQQALRETAERVQLALDAGAIIGTWYWDVPKSHLTADELWARSFAFDPAHCRSGLSEDEIQSTVHPADLPGLRAYAEEAVARGGDYRHQHRVLHADGAYRWVEAAGRVELDETGKPLRFAGVLVDITARKQAEEARSLLTLEVDHRARNALAMVQSLVRLTDASDPARYREQVIGRIDAMARAQGSLSRSNWQGGALDDIVREELSAHASPCQFELAGPRTTLPAEQVQPLSMIIHELVTNAMKHGALSAADGRIEVTWMLRPQGEAELTWRESGGPAVTPPGRKGFGSRLIERLSAQLGGSTMLAWQAAGLVARLTWRAAPAEAADHSSRPCAPDLPQGQVETALGADQRA